MAKQYRTALIIEGDAKGGIRAIQATDEQLTKLNRRFDDSGKRSRQFAKDVDSTSRELEFLKNTASGVGAALAGAFAVSNLAGQAEMIRQVDSLARSLSVNTQTLQQWQYAGQQVGLEADKMGDIFKDVSDKVGDFAATGGGEAADLFKNLNLNIRELQSLSPDQQILKIAEAVNQLEDPSQRTFYFESLADDMVRLQPLLADNARGLRQAAAEADAIGVAMSGIDTQRAVEAAQAMDQLQGVATGLSNTLVADLGPGLADATSDLTTLIQQAGGAEEILGDVATVAGTLATVYLARRLGPGLLTVGKNGLSAGSQIAEGMAIALGGAGRLNQALVVTQARIAATSAAARAMNGALALVGGPAGVAILAAGALFTYHEELDAMLAPAQRATQRVNDLTNAINLNSEAAVEGQLVNLTAQMVQLEQQADAARQQLEEINATSNDPGPFRNSMVMGEDADARREAYDALREAEEQLAANGEASDQLRERLQLLREQGVETISTVSDLGGAASETAEANEDLDNSYQSLLDTLYPLQKRQRDYAEDKATLIRYALEENKTNAWLDESIRRLDDSYRNAGDAAEVYGFTGEQAAAQVGDAFDASSALAVRSLERIDDAGVEMWRGFLDGTGNAMDQFEDIVLDTVAEVAHQLITKPLTLNISAMITGQGGGQGASGGVGSMGSLGDLSSIGRNVYNGIVDGFGSINWMGAPTSYSGGFAGSATSGMNVASNGTSYFGGTMSNFGGMTGLASAGAGMAGNWLGGQAFGQSEYGSTLGTAGALVGTYFGGPAGAAIGSFAGQALGSLFGGRNWEQVGSGLALNVSDGRVGGSSYVKEEYDGGWFGGSGSRKRASVLSRSVTDELQAVYEATEASLEATLQVLGYQSDALDGFSTGLKTINTKGMSSEEAQQAMQDWLQGVLGQMADFAAGDVSAFAQAGETTTDTLMRLASSLNGVNPLLEDMGLTTLDASLAGGQAASHIAELSGGLDALATNIESYYQSVYSEQELLDRQVRNAEAVLARFNQATGNAIETEGGLRDLVESLDLMTASGQKTYAMAMQVAGVFDQLEQLTQESLARVRAEYDSLMSEAESAYSAAQSAARQALQSFNSQAYQQQIDLLTLAGHSEEILTIQREKELASIDESLRPIQERIWQLQDEQAALADTTAAGTKYAEALAQARDQLGGVLSSINEWLDQQAATGGTPGGNLQESQAQFARQLIAAQNGDRDALNSITQYADQYLAAGQSYYGSGTGYQSIRGDLLDALKDLPDQVSAEEYIAEEIKQALADAVDNLPGGIADALSPMFSDIDANLDGLIDYDEFGKFFAGLASDEELRRLYARLDADGNGTISALEAVKGSTDQVDENTESIEERSLDQLAELNSLVDEMTRSTDQFVGLNSTMVSLRESINALGVAQEEIARIEAERLAAEQAERERLEREREEAERQARIDQQIADLTAAIEKRDTANDNIESGTATLADKLADNQVESINSFLASRIGSDGIFSNSEWESVQDEIEKNLSGTAAQYAMHAGAYLKRESANATAEARIRELEGKDRGSESIDVGGILDQLDVTDDMSRAQAYLWRYPDVQREWEIRTGTVKDSGADTAEEWATYHYNKYGRDEGRKFALGGVFDNGIVTQPTTFDMGLMGEAGPEAIMPLSRGADGSLGVRAELPPLVIPPLASGGNTAQLESLLRDNNRLMAQNAELLKKLHAQGEADLRQRGVGFSRQIDETRKGNKLLSRMASDSRLEASKA